MSLQRVMRLARRLSRKLSTDLSDSRDALEAEPATRDFFGEEFITAYTRMRRYELSRLADHVSDWERTEYLELF